MRKRPIRDLQQAGSGSVRPSAKATAMNDGARCRSHASIVIRNSKFASRAFTLVELVVSVGVLSILLVVAGSVFTLTLKSSGQATALIHVNEQIRAFEELLRSELRAIDPERGLMIIQPNIIHGFWNEEELQVAKELRNEAGIDVDAEDITNQNVNLTRDPEREELYFDNGTLKQRRALPRADMLGFFTNREASSVRHPDLSGRTQWVVYGHAQIGEYNRDGSWNTNVSPSLWDFSAARLSDETLDYDPSQGTIRGRYTVDEPPHVTNHDVIFPYAASQWHLARRAVIIVNRILDPNGTPPYYPAQSLNDSASFLGNGDDQDDPLYRNLEIAGYLRDGRRDVIVDRGSDFSYESDVTKRFQRDDNIGRKVNEWNPVFDSNSSNDEAVINWLGRAQFATAPTFAQSKRLGAFFMPQCASFKVEWALDVSDVDYGDLRGLGLPGEGETIWIDPAHLIETIETMQPKFDDVHDNYCPTVGTFQQVEACKAKVREIEQAVVGSLLPRDPEIDPNDDHFAPPIVAQGLRDCMNEHKPSRFVDPGPDGSSDPTLRSTHIFYAQEPHPSCYNTFFNASGVPKDGAMEVAFEPDPLFPKALRITIDVYDAEKRLERPIRHVMILPVGQD